MRPRGCHMAAAKRSHKFARHQIRIPLCGRIRVLGSLPVDVVVEGADWDS
jgi:hypothetical protein